MNKQPPDELQQLRAQIYALGRKKRTAGLTTREAAEYERLNKERRDKVGTARGE